MHPASVPYKKTHDSMRFLYADDDGIILREAEKRRLRCPAFTR